VSLCHSRRLRRLVVLLAWLCIALGLSAQPARAAEPAKVTVRVATALDGTLQITAIVVDATGAAVAGTPVVLKVRTTFGWLPVAKGTTDASGRVQVTLPPSLRAGEIAAEAGEDAQVSASIRIGKGTIREPAARPGRDALRDLSPQPGFISPYPVPTQVGLLAVILGGIWATYGYVVWLLSRIRVKT